MKRPQGFAQPAASGVPRPPGKSGAAKAAPPAVPPGQRPAPANSRSGPDTTTEPITIPAAAVAPGFPLRKPRSGKPRSGKPSSGKPRTGTPREDASATEPASSPTLTAAGARKQLRVAKRARKRYEREEVRRFTWRSRRRRTVWLVAVGAIVVLGGVVVVGAYSPLMALRTIDVVGTNRVPAADVVAALDGHVGTPLPLLDFDQVKTALSQFTLIQSYVTESRPPGTLVVRVVERDPVGVIASGAGFDLVDAAGVVIQSGPEAPAGYPAIDAAKGVDSAGFAAAAAVISALPDAMRTQLETVRAATKDDVVLNLVGGARVVWGSAEESEYKAVVLGALMVGHPVGTVNEYDVSSPDSAVLR